MKEKLDILLVNPSNRAQMYSGLGSSVAAIEPPLWTGLIAAFIRQNGFSVKIIDADAEGWNPEYTAEKIIEFEPFSTCIGAVGANPSVSSTPKMAAASKILNILRNNVPSVKTFLYGIHPSALPEKTLKEETADFICRGEPLYTILNSLKILKAGKNIMDYKIDGLWYRRNDKIISNGWGELVQNLDDLPFVAWDLLPMDRYRAHNWHCFGDIDHRQPYGVIYTSLGCPFNCTYCNIHSLYRGKPHIRFRSPRKVVEEIDLLVRNYRVENIKILDEIFILNESRVIEICDLIIQREYNLNMWAYARIDTINEMVLKKVKQAGVNWLAFGIESASQTVRDSVAKGKFGLDAIRKAIKMTHDAGIYVVANFIFGLPDDDMKSMQDTLELAKELNCEYTNFYVAMAYPGSQLYEDAIKRGVKLPDNWLGYSQFSEETYPLPTKHLTSAEVLRFRDEAFEECCTNPRYLEMITKKFGLKTTEHIKELLKYKIRRKYA